MMDAVGTDDFSEEEDDEGSLWYLSREKNKRDDQLLTYRSAGGYH
jgi:hypothetical protein